MPCHRLVLSRPRRFRLWRHLSSLSGKVRLGLALGFQASSGKSDSANWPGYEANHVRQKHWPGKFFSTLENLLSRDIVSIFYAIILIFSWSLQYSGNSRYGQEPFPSSVHHVENRNLRASESSRWLSRISGYVLKALQLSLLPLLVFKFHVTLLTHPSSLPFTGFL